MGVKRDVAKGSKHRQAGGARPQEPRGIQQKVLEGKNRSGETRRKQSPGESHEELSGGKTGVCVQRSLSPETG